MHPRRPPGFIEPCQPSAADKPPSGPRWIHEIKHDGYRLMARRDGASVRLLTFAPPTLNDVFEDGGCIARPPVGAAVRLRSNSEVTGVALGDGFDPNRLRVQWDDTDEVTDCIAAKLELAQ